MSSAFGIWLLQAVFYTLPWALLYSSKRTCLNISIRTIAILILLTIPPLGYFVWLPPIASAGLLFPGFGWFGLGLTLLFMLASVVSLCVIKKGWPLLICIILALLSIFANCLYLPKQMPNDWIAINTKLGNAPKSIFDEPQREAKLIEKTREAILKGNKVILFPENIALDWLSGTQYQWKHISELASNKGVTIILGAQQDLLNGSMNNMLILLGKGNWRIYPARQPMPLGLWKPWEKDTYNLHWGLSGKFSVENHVIGYLICYEQIIPWPVLSSFLSAPYPTVIVSAANQWFATRSGYVKQHNVMQSFARLFGVPTITAINTGRSSLSSESTHVRGY